jgi:hypothetical protein
MVWIHPATHCNHAQQHHDADVADATDGQDRHCDAFWREASLGDGTNAAVVEETDNPFLAASSQRRHSAPKRSLDGFAAAAGV